MLLRMNSPLLGPAPSLGTIDRMLSDVLGAFESAPGLPAPRVRARPAMNIHEDAEAFTIEAELPGASLDDIRIDVADDTVTIAGELGGAGKTQEGREGWTVVRSERFKGSFSRTIALRSPIDAKKAAATLESGVLRVTLPKAASAKPRRIQVSGAKKEVA